MRALILLGFLMTIPGFAAVTQVRLHLPPGVTKQGSSENGNRLDIRLSLSAFEATVRADPRVTIGLKEGSCILSLSIASNHAPAVEIANVAAGPVVIELVDGDGPALQSPAALTPPVASGPAGPSAPSVPDRAAGAAGPQAPTVPGAANAATADDTAKSDKATDLFTKALSSLPEAVKFDPVALADYAIPASGAATVIGSTGTLARPATPREVVTGLLTHFDQDNRLQTGFSVAFTPYTLLRKIPLSADEYQKDAGKRFLANLQVSFAARTDDDLVTSGDKAARFGAGLTMVFFDKGDLRMDNDFLTTLTAALAKGAPRFTADNAFGSTPDATPANVLKTAGETWRKEQAKRWNAASAGLGIAPAFLSLTGKLSDLRDDGAMTWLTVALPGPGALEDNTQFILGGSGRFGQRVQVDSMWSRADVLDFGAQLRYGGEAGNFFAEAQYRFRRGGADDSEKFVYELGIERRVADGVWLNLSWTNDDAISGGKQIRTGVRYGFGSKAVLSPLK
jgi:hypothetical protein